MFKKKLGFDELISQPTIRKMSEKKMSRESSKLEQSQLSNGCV